MLSTLRSYNNDGVMAYQCHEYYKAIDLLSEGLKVQLHAHLLSNRSATWAKLLQFDKALHDARKCLELKPNWSEVLCRIGNVFMKQNLFDKAHDIYIEAVRGEPWNE
jgi:tetratricopeptide (TPR) repeat protein